MKEQILASLNEAKLGLENFINNSSAIESIEKAAEVLTNTFQNGGTVFSCGNGGSMSDAIHFAEELSGKFRNARAALPAVAISDPGHISCVSNDFGYEQIFRRFLEAHLKNGDTLLAISTSGTSANVIKAAEFARENGAYVIALTGKENSVLGSISDVEISAPTGAFADRVQEIHIKVIHILIEMIERKLFPENYK